MRAIKTTTISVLASALLAGAAVGVAAQAEEPAESTTPVHVTWTAGEPASVIDGTFDEGAGTLRGRAFVDIPVEASDPRLSGLATIVINGNQELGTDTGAILESRAYRIVNDGGEWVGHGTLIQAGDLSAEAPAIARDAVVLTGEGDYAGLTFVSAGDYREANAGEGVLYGIAVPPAPDVPDAMDVDAAE